MRQEIRLGPAVLPALAGPQRAVAVGGRPAGRRHGRLRAADVLTLTRVAAATLVLAATVGRPGRRLRRLSWACLVCGATLSDWLDGPLARRHGPSAIGAWLDLETDSLLTLCAGIAGVRGGRLPALCVVPPLARYLVQFVTWCAAPATGNDLRHAWWAPATGTAQMAVFIAALAPWGPRVPGPWLRRAAGPVAALQLLSLLAPLLCLRRRPPRPTPTLADAPVVPKDRSRRERAAGSPNRLSDCRLAT